MYFTFKGADGEFDLHFKQKAAIYSLTCHSPLRASAPESWMFQTPQHNQNPVVDRTLFLSLLVTTLQSQSDSWAWY